jgi:hypothetical protein
MAKVPRSHRIIRLVRSPSLDGLGVFSISDGPKTVSYALRELACDIGGRGFVVHRLGLGTLYHVRVGNPYDCTCECMGFLKYSHCKHIDALRALIDTGLL